MKRFLAFLCASVLFFTGFPLWVTAEEAAGESVSAAADTDYENAVAFLQALSLAGNLNFDMPEATVSRADFASAMLSLLGFQSADGQSAVEDNRNKYLGYTNDPDLDENGDWIWNTEESPEEEVPENATPFYDVVSTDPRWEDIKMAAQIGIMRGDSNRYFRPDDAVSVQEALKVLVDACGAKILTENNFPSGYITIAKRLELDTGLGVPIGEGAITVRDIAIAFYNAMHTEIYERVSYGSEKSTIIQRQGKTLLKYVFQLDMAEGQVTADSVTGLSSYQGTGGALIKIDDALFYWTETERILGRRVRAYYKVDGTRKEIRYLAVSDTNREVVIDAEDIVDYALPYLSYWDGDKQRSVLVGADINLIYNGKALLDYQDGGMKMRENRTTNFENKFGMFIHWGIYAQSGMQDQVIARYDMQNKEYEKYADVFNPTEYNPAEWVALAKAAGMKYICFTAKHHDGFCMWDTKYTDYNIMHTPYGRDVLKMLADECKKQGMLLSLYYSCPDWHHACGYNPNSTHQWKAVNKDNPKVERYIEYVRNQITELMTNYGKIYTLFWDIPPKIEDKSLNELVRRLQPGIYINDRGFSEGDFSTPERDYDEAATTRFKRMTEACNSVGEQSWGYRAKEDYHSLRYLTHSIDRIMSMGGSYLLNVGPTEKGVIPEKSKDIIKRVGSWYNRMNGCLEGTEEDLFDYQVAKYKYIANRKNGKTYLHFYEGINSSAVALKAYPAKPVNVRLMNTGDNLPFEIELLPEFFDIETGKGDGEYLHIFDIPIDDLHSEPVVIEIEW